MTAWSLRSFYAVRETVTRGKRWLHNGGKQTNIKPFVNYKSDRDLAYLKKCKD